jgi:hypothetical protein
MTHYIYRTICKYGARHASTMEIYLREPNADDQDNFIATMQIKPRDSSAVATGSE